MRRLRASSHANWADYYFAYQAELARSVLVPQLRQWGLWRPKLRILDVGCGQAGASDALAQAGAQVDGLEIDARLLEEGRRRTQSTSLRLFEGDITRGELLGSLASDYDLVLFRDVLEHIPNIDAALRESVCRLAVDGKLLVIFPPWWSAFGGHQQTIAAKRRLGVRLGKAPFAHWLGGSLHRKLAGLDAADPQWRELETIRAARLDLKGMARHAAHAGLRPCARRDYLLRPSYRLRYGLPVLGAGPFGRIPVLNEILVNGSFQLFRRANASEAESSRAQLAGTGRHD